MSPKAEIYTPSLPDARLHGHDSFTVIPVKLAPYTDTGTGIQVGWCVGTPGARRIIQDYPSCDSSSWMRSLRSSKPSSRPLSRSTTSAGALPVNSVLLSLWDSLWRFSRHS